MPIFSARSPRRGAFAIAIVVAGIALLLLALQLPADPVTGITWSGSPFTDEGWLVMGARNQVLLGQWVTDEWRLFWAQLPFNFAMVGSFELFGVGIVQARLVTVLCSVAAVGLTTWFVATHFGNSAGWLTGLGMASCSLLLYQGRLALLDPMVLFFLIAGLVLLLAGSWQHSLRWSIAGGAALACAIGTKPSATAAVIGILLGVAIVGARTPGVVRRVGAAVLVIALIGAAWLAVVLPQEGLVDSILQMWPQQQFATSPAAALKSVFDYVKGSDGAIGLTAPLLAGAAIGIVFLVARWRSLAPTQRILLAAVVGWLVLGMGMLLLVSYRPNHYVVPMIPPLAILTGWAGMSLLDGLRRLMPLFSRRVLHVGALGFLSLALALPGLLTWSYWQANATYQLPQVQAELIELIGEGEAIEGSLAPTLAMRVPAATIVTNFGVNAGDLYSEYSVRWLLLGPDQLPKWIDAHPEAWAARELVGCYSWPGVEACLLHLP